MKKLRWIFIVALLVAVALLFWHRRSSRSTPSPSPSAQSSEPVSETSPTPSAPSQSAIGPATSAQPVSKRQQMQNLLGAVNHKAIEFYGKVVDQQGAPLGGVSVYASVIYNSGLSAGVDKKQTETDAAGLFSISGMKGRTLGIGLEKDGYEYGGEHGPFQFTEMVMEAERYHPDPKNPVVFVMWKLQGAEPMIYFKRKGFDLLADGTPVRIDLATGKKVPTGGDMIVTLQQPIAQPGQRLTHYPWTAKIAADGLQESAAKLMYLAPENGYVSALTYGEKGDERVQERHVEKSFYLKTRDGRYARVRIDLTSDTNPDYPSTMVLTWWLNPKPGSRNLEFDPKKAITPPR